MGGDEVRALKVRTASLYCIWYSIGSQCKAWEYRVGIISGKGANENFGESILNTLDTCYVVLGRSIENGICIV